MTHETNNMTQFNCVMLSVSCFMSPAKGGQACVMLRKTTDSTPMVLSFLLLGVL